MPLSRRLVVMKDHPSRLTRNSMEQAALVMVTHFSEIAEVPVD